MLYQIANQKFTRPGDIVPQRRRNTIKLLGRQVRLLLARIAGQCLNSPRRFDVMRKGSSERTK